MTYAIVDNCDAAKATMAIADGILTISGLTDKTETSAVVSATQKGKIQFVNIPVEIDEEKASVNDVAVDADVRIFPVPATDRLNIRTAMTDYAVRIYATNGSLVMEQARQQRKHSRSCKPPCKRCLHPYNRQRTAIIQTPRCRQIEF